MCVLCRLAGCFCHLAAVRLAELRCQQLESWDRCLKKSCLLALCCYRQPVKVFFGDCKSWSRWQKSFWRFIVHRTPEAEASERRRDCGRRTSRTHFSPGERERQVEPHTKEMTIMAGLCWCVEDILSIFSQSKFRNASLWKWIESSRFEGINLKK